MATISSTIELVDKMSSTLSTIEGNINSMKNTLKSVSGEQSSIDGFSWKTFLKNAEDAGEKMVKIGSKMTAAVTTPLVLLGKKMYGNAVDYESAFAGVKKTTDATDEEFQVLYNDLLKISETTPTGFVEAAEIMEMAGQLGVAKEQLSQFTETYIALQAATNIQGEEGAADLARFLNVTEKTTANVDKVGGVIVALGNNFATTENEILSMATRMGATADLAGFSSAEILAFSAALSSVGINAEAGGSAAGKLMKKMQLAAEVGGKAQDAISGIHWTETDKKTGVSTEVWLKDLVSNGLEFVNYLDTLKSAEKVDIADQLGMTTDALQNMADSWLALDQFSEVMGLDKVGFLESWDDSAAKSMLRFFQGLGGLDAEKGNSVLAQLAEMDITEIRLSNLVAAMSGNSELFAQALAMAYKEYGLDYDANALAEEFGKRLNTQEAQNQMLGNKLDNSMADLGENLVQMIQPALDKVNELLTAFNSLGEADQSAILTAFAIFAAGGPIVTAVGATVEIIGKIGTGIMTAYHAVAGWFGRGGLAALLSNPATWGIAAGGALLLFISYLDNIPTKFDELAKGVQDIPITISQADYDETMSKISEVQEALNGLKAGEVRTEYENTSTAVKYGFGTNEMYGTALAYEAAKANANINQVASDYAVKMQEAQKKIADAAASGDTAAATAAKAEYEGLRTALDSEISALKSDYTQNLSALFDGMASQYPEAASVLTNAADNYDILLGANRILYNWDDDSFDNIEESSAAWTEQAMKVAEQAFNAGLYDNRAKGVNEDLNFAAGLLGSGNEIDWWNWDTVKGLIESGYSGFDLNTLLTEAFENSTANLKDATQTVSDNPVLASYLQALINDPSITENLDTTQLSGALEGIFKTLDFKNALEQAGDNPYNFGKFVSEGLGQGITDNASVATDAGNQLGTDTINNIKSALGVASPSKFMIIAGLNVDEGLAQGIGDGTSIAIAAATEMGTAVIMTIETLLSPANGMMIGVAFTTGISQGILSIQGIVIAASRSVSTAAVNTARGILSSGAGASIGSNFASGLAEGIRSGIGAVRSAASALANAALAATSSILKIHSPSRETYWQGEMMIQGYVDAIKAGSSTMNRTIGNVIGDSETRWNQGIWSIVSGFNSLEQKMWDDELNDVEEKFTISDADVSKIRSLAEREVINHFTTAEVKVEMTNNNNINSDMDIDGIISRLEDKVAERLEVVAEGVYS